MVRSSAYSVVAGLCAACASCLPQLLIAPSAPTSASVNQQVLQSYESEGLQNEGSQTAWILMGTLQSAAACGVACGQPTGGATAACICKLASSRCVQLAPHFAPVWQAGPIGSPR